MSGISSRAAAASIPVSSQQVGGHRADLGQDDDRGQGLVERQVRGRLGDLARGSARGPAAGRAAVRPAMTGRRRQAAIAAR